MLTFRDTKFDYNYLQTSNHRPSEIPSISRKIIDLAIPLVYLAITNNCKVR